MTYLRLYVDLNLWPSVISVGSTDYVFLLTTQVTVGYSFTSMYMVLLLIQHSSSMLL